MNKKALICTLTVVASVALSPRTVHAEDLVVSGNGEGSQNNVSVQNTSNANVQQTNDAQVQNNDQTTAATGNNNASNNGGDATIQTGNATTNTSVTNNNINTNNATVDPCNCEGTTTVKISGNSANSTNTVGVGQNQTTTVGQINNATITNNTSISANTGNNKANNNSGDVTIKTGAIYATTLLANTHINNNSSVIGQTNGFVSISVSGNGAGSENKVTLAFENAINITKVNNAVLI